MFRRCALGIAVLLTWSVTSRGDEVDLKKFTSEPGKFSVLMPKNAATTTQSMDTPIGKVKVTMTAKEEGGIHYLIAYTDYPADKVKAMDANKSLDGARDGSLKKTGGKLILEKKITIGKAKYPGRELLIRLQDGKLWLRQRLYMVKLRQYQAVMVGPENLVKDKTAEKFFQSFELRE